MAFKLTTRDRVKTYMGFKAGENDQDALIDQLIDGVSQRFVKYLNHVMQVKERVQDISVRNTQFRFILKFLTVHSVTLLESDFNRDFTGAQDIDAEDFTFDEESGELIVDQAFVVPGWKALRATYVCGFAFPRSAYLSRSLDTPATPSVGDVYLSGPGPFTGEWLAQGILANQLVTLDSSGPNVWSQKTQEESFIENHEDLALAADIQTAFEIQTSQKIDANYTAIRSHVTTFKQSEFVERVQSILDMNKNMQRTQQ